MYNYIINPVTNRKVSIYGNIGKNILIHYLKQLNGGSVSDIPVSIRNKLRKYYKKDADKILDELSNLYENNIQHWGQNSIISVFSHHGYVFVFKINNFWSHHHRLTSTIAWQCQNTI